MKLACRIQHHPARADILDRLLPLLDGLPVEVVADPEPDGTPDPWRTYRECLTRPWDGTHLLVVQDDAVPCAGFADKARAAVAVHPEPPLCFFVPGIGVHRTHMLRAHKLGEPFTELRGVKFVPMVATVWPRAHADALLAYSALIDARAQKAINRESDDGRAGKYVLARRVSAWATVPCLVEHPDDVPRLARPERTRKRGRIPQNPHRRAAVAPAQE